MTKETAIKLFHHQQIRSVWNEQDSKWYFSVADVVEALTDSTNVKDYIKKMRKRDPELNSNWGTFCPPLEMLNGAGVSPGLHIRKRRRSWGEVSSAKRIFCRGN